MASTDHASETTLAEMDDPVEAVLEAIDQIGSEWRLRVLAALHEDEKRFNELKRETGASSSTLSRVLDHLEEEDLIARRVEDRPIATYYSPTPKGKALCPVWEAMANWSGEWVCGEGEAAAGD
jgi:DNA-binding HxlR family transcriptional regulator